MLRQKEREEIIKLIYNGLNKFPENRKRHTRLKLMIEKEER